MHNSRIILATITARYAHTAFGLRCLWANLGAFQRETEIREFHLKQAPLDIAERLLAAAPEILGVGAYIWNVDRVTQVVQAIKGVRPEIVVVIGGPEASHEYEGTPLFEAADYLVRGEGEAAFAALVRDLAAGTPPKSKMIEGGRPDLADLVPPYDAYTDEDLQHRLIYVEGSRGCPFHCEFCLSSLEPCVREFPLEPFLDALDKLIARGTRNLLFVDRTFNLRPSRVREVLHFLKPRWREGLRLHFEIVPDCLTDEMLDLIAEFPPGALHLELGVQTFNPAVQEAISRRQNLEKTVSNFRFLRTRTGALLHADLIIGLPGEDERSFAEGFDRLVGLAPHEIQAGVLKRLKGTPIQRHAGPHAMVFAAHPPYEILQTDCLCFGEAQRLKRFARYLDLYYNTGHFPKSLDLLWRLGPSPFGVFMGLTEHLWAACGRTHEIPLAQLARHLYEYLLDHGLDEAEAAAAIRDDFRDRPGRSDKLEFLPRP